MTRTKKSDKDKKDKEKDKKQRKLSGGDDLLRGFLHVHETISSSDGSNATPRRYMTFLRTYEQLYSKKKEAIETKQQHLKVLE